MPNFLCSAETNSVPVFSTNSYLADEEKEMEFLRKLCEIMVILLLPRGYSLPPLKVLFSEILSFKSRCSFRSNVDIKSNDFTLFQFSFR